jgi:cell wall-associated NlpC family hydrolase
MPNRVIIAGAHPRLLLALALSLFTGTRPLVAQAPIATTASSRRAAPSAETPASRYSTPEEAAAAARTLWDKGQHSSARRLMAIAQAYRQLGRPYQYGGNGKSAAAVDCSAFVQWAEGRAGIRLPRTSKEQSRVGNPIPRSTDALEDGDLLFFGIRGVVSHVGIYIGGGRFIHSSSSLGGVAISSLIQPRWDHLWLSARRVADGEDRKPS